MAKNKIMIVEDERLIAEDLKIMLEEFGYSVVYIATNGKEALEQVVNYDLDLVTMDINLGKGMDGVETATALYRNQGIPIVFISAYANESILKEAKKANPYGYIIKPFIEKELKASIQMVFYKIEMEHTSRGVSNPLRFSR